MDNVFPRQPTIEYLKQQGKLSSETLIEVWLTGKFSNIFFYIAQWRFTLIRDIVLLWALLSLMGEIGWFWWVRPDVHWGFYLLNICGIPFSIIAFAVLVTVLWDRRGSLPEVDKPQWLGFQFYKDMSEFLIFLKKFGVTRRLILPKIFMTILSFSIMSPLMPSRHVEFGFLMQAWNFYQADPKKFGEVVQKAHTKKDLSRMMAVS